MDLQFVTKKSPASLVLSENEFAEPSLSTNLIRCGAKAVPLLNEEFASKGIPVKPIIKGSYYSIFFSPVVCRYYRYLSKKT